MRKKSKKNKKEKGEGGRSKRKLGMLNGGLVAQMAEVRATGEP